MKMTLRTEHTLVDEQGRPVEPGARVRNIETGLIGTIGRAEETPEGWDVYFHIDMGNDRPYDLKAAEVVRRFSLQEPEAEPKPSAELDDIIDHLERRDAPQSTEHLIIWALLPLAKLPNTVANLVKDAVHGDLDEQCRAALAAVDAIARLRREPDAEIPF